MSSYLTAKVDEQGAIPSVFTCSHACTRASSLEGQPDEQGIGIEAVPLPPVSPELPWLTRAGPCFCL